MSRLIVHLPWESPMATTLAAGSGPGYEPRLSDADALHGYPINPERHGNGHFRKTPRNKRQFVGPDLAQPPEVL